MKRRNFTQAFALGAGAAALHQGNGATAAEEGKPRKVPAIKPKELEKLVTVEDFVPIAKKNLPKATFDYITTGSEAEVTLNENRRAFEKIQFMPPILHGISQANLGTTVLKQPISVPVILAPVAGQQMFHTDGGRAAARAAGAMGTIYGVSSSVGNTPEEIAQAAKGPLWFQIYMPKERTVARQLIKRVEKSGYKAIILTVDLGERKDQDLRNGFALPKDMLYDHLKGVGFDVRKSMSYDELSKFNAQAWDLWLSWDVIKWVRSVTNLPIILKGVLAANDAKKAVSLGVDAIVVSNHGGRRLDGVPASIAMLDNVVKAVGQKAEVYLDSGVRRGSDVFKALARGAKAVLVGRAYAWALAAGGEPAVKRAIQILREQLELTMVSSGCSNVSQITPELLLN